MWRIYLLISYIANTGSFVTLLLPPFSHHYEKIMSWLVCVTGQGEEGRERKGMWEQQARCPGLFAWEVLSSFFLAHCGLIYLWMCLLLLYIIKKPKKAIILQKRRQEKPLGTQGLSANHYLRLAQGWQLGSRFMIVSHGP